VVTVSVEVPDEVTEAGLNEAVAPEGRPPASRATVPLKVFRGVMVTE
jgi:hypothetical protein